MKSSSSALASPTGVVEGVLFSRWALTDLSASAQAEAHEARRHAEATARQDAAARAEEEAAEREDEQALLESARKEEEVEQRVRDAYQSGYEEGRREGEIGEGARLRHAVRAAEEALDELRAGEVRWTGSIEENICALAVAVARHLIGRELKGDVQPVLDLVRSALSEFPIDQPIRIRISPNDLHAVRQIQDAESAVTQGRDARWLADSQVAPGGCVVEGRDRIVDGRVDTALERIYRRLTYTHA